VIPPLYLRRIRLTAVALLVTMVALAWRLTVGGATVPAAQALRPPRAVPLTDVHPYGANFFLEREPDVWNRERTVAMAQEAHIRWAKQHFPWFDLEREPGSFQWDKYDDIVNLYRAHGMEVIARLDFPPSWVEPAEWVPEAIQQTANFPPADVDDFARFVGATVAHFRGRVRFYQIWNEPNLVTEWGYNPSHPVSPAEYTALLRAAAEAARAADPAAVILSAPLAYNVEAIDLGGNLSDLDFLRGMYEAGAADAFDILSANAFGMDRPPADPPAPDTLNFRRAELQREIMVQAGDAETPIWINEYGWNAAPASLPPGQLKWQRVRPEQQADWTVGGIRWAQRSWPWAGVFSTWYFRQWGDITPEDADYYFAMVDVDFTPHRVYAAVREAAPNVEVAGPGYWEERSAPVRLQERRAADCTDPGCVDWQWLWTDERSSTDRNILVSSSPGARLSLAFSGSAVSVRAETGPANGSPLVEIDGQPARVPGGSGAVVLSSAEPGWRELPLAEGLGPGLHELALTVGGAGGRVAIDGFRVAPFGGGPRVDRVALGLAALAVALGLLLAVDARRIARRVRL
jgi:hypothetical protein